MNLLFWKSSQLQGLGFSPNEMPNRTLAQSYEIQLVRPIELKSLLQGLSNFARY